MRHPLNYVRSRRCAQCYGAVVEKRIDDEWQIVCPKGCEPGGHVSEAYVKARMAEDLLEAHQVIQNYPELAPEGEMSAEEIEAAAEALWPTE